MHNLNECEVVWYNKRAILASFHRVQSYNRYCRPIQHTPRLSAPNEGVPEEGGGRVLENHMERSAWSRTVVLYICEHSTSMRHIDFNPFEFGTDSPCQVHV